MSEVPGTAVQTYTEPRLELMLDSRLSLIFRDAFWPQWSGWIDVTLSGTDGLHTTDLVTSPGIEKFEDIKYVFREASSHPLARAPARHNLNAIEGTTARYIDAYPSIANRLFRVLPKASTGTLNVFYRVLPNYTDEDIIAFESDVLEYGVCWDILIDDATNPGQVEKFATLYNDAYNVLRDRLVDPEIEVGGDGGEPYPTEWFVG